MVLKDFVGKSWIYLFIITEILSIIEIEIESNPNKYFDNIFFNLRTGSTEENVIQAALFATEYRKKGVEKLNCD